MSDPYRNVSMIVLRALMSKRGWHAFSHMVRVESFESNEFRRIYQHLERLHVDTEGDVPLAAIRADVAVQYAGKPELVEEMGLVLDRLDRAEQLDHGLMQALIRRFLERGIAYEIAEHISNHVDKTDFSFNTVADLAARAVEVGERVTQAVTDVVASPLSGAADNRRVAHGLGVSHQLDAGLRGGVAGGELSVYLAGPSVGKTSFLCRTGASHAADGGRVLHVTLEINTRKVVERYDQCWTSRGREDLETPDGQEAVSLARDLVRQAGGHVWVVDWSYLTVSAADIGSLVRRMKGTKCPCCDRMMAPTMIIVDYLELMSPNKLPGKEMRQIFSAVGKEHRALARNLDLPLCTAWQVNRAGNDVNLLSKKDVSESWDIIKIADIILGLNQTMEELNNKRLRVNIIKQRESTNRGVFELYSDLDRMVVRDTKHEDTRDQVNAIIGRTDAETEVARGSGS